MWQFARDCSHSQAERAANMQQLLQDTTDRLLAISSVFLLCCALVLTATWGGERVPALMGSALAVGLLFWLSHWLRRSRYLAALIVWLAGMVLAIVLGAWLWRNPAILFLSSVLPLVAVITISGWAGVAVEGLVAALALAASRAPIDYALPQEQALLIIAAGAFCGLLGWATRGALLGATDWSIASYEEANQSLAELREQQLELEQSRDDLIQANRELARLSDRLKVLEHIAEESRQAKTEFVANVSHELRTPLNMIIGFTDVISRSPQSYGGRLSPSLLTDIGAIRRNAQHLAALINDVLDLSQVEAGRMALSRDWVALQPIVESALTVVKGLFESRGLYLVAEVEPDLPPVYCDETRVRQVIINLLSNAGRFTERGGVVLGCHLAGSEVVISVADTGPGIAEKDQKRVFEPFQQADVSTRRRHGGSGLGLTISRQFAEMHGGKMWLESEVGVGTTISFSLPVGSLSPDGLDGLHSLRRSLVSDDEVGYRLRTPRSHAPLPSPGQRYVVVDPEQTLQRLLTRYLPEVEVQAAPDIPGAVETLRHSPAQALVVNVSPFDEVPSTALGDLPFGTPAITCWLPGEHEAAKRLGVVEYLIKPLSQDKLLATLAGLGPGMKTILLVDDEEDELHLFARMLESGGQGYSTLQVTNGRRALSMLRSRHPDAMLLDLVMPGMDGFRVLEEKRRDPEIRDIPVIVISSRDPAGDPIVSNTLTVHHTAGLSQRSLIACIQALGSILAPSSVQEG